MRDFDNFKNYLNKIVPVEQFNNITRKALFSEETSPDEISLILSKYEVRNLFDLELLKSFIDNLSLQKKLVILIDTITSLISGIFNQIQDSIFGLIIDLVISDYGDKRLLGRAIFDTIKPTIENLNILGIFSKWHQKPFN